jgi:predicted ATP-dependent endonuclease of OLD family
LKAIDGLNHAAAVTFMVDVTNVEGEVTPLLRLPENNNGLGYQNLISMIFRLMSFRDAWMRVGKASKTTQAVEFEPLHLVLIEEPEAHLHAQVQQVFVKKAYDVLRQHDDLKGSQIFRTQLIVSTHSSHVAHEIPFANLRYFRRLPAGMAARIPVSTVINLPEVFGATNETQRFVTRYLRAHHADLFFADAAILVEGPAERMLLPNLIRNNFERLNQSYVTLLEIGGSHAHRLKPLIDCLGLLTLIITDLDSVDAAGNSAQPQKGADQNTGNDTLKTWVPKLSNVDALMDTDEKNKILEDPDDQLFAVRAAYQTPVPVQLLGVSKAETAQPYTFEDALAFENLEFFSKLPGG